MNWRGPPLETHEVVVETIAATTTKTGLTIQAALDTNTYQRGIKITHSWRNLCIVFCGGRAAAWGTGPAGAV